MRLFTGFRLQLSNEYDPLIAELHRRTHYDTITWVKPNLFHITLRFIGKTHSSQVKPIAETLQNIAANTPELDLEINKLGKFGPYYAPECIWLGIQNTPQLQQLYNIVDTSLPQLGVELKKENFVPHISLGRIRKLDNKKRFYKMLEELQPTFHQKFHFTHFSLIRSQLEKNIPIYTTLYDFPLLGENMPENGSSTPASSL